MLKNLLILCLLCSLTACASTETPMSITAKTMLTTRQTVITAAQTADVLCKQKVMSVDDCMAAKKAYEQFQTCYEPVSNAFLVYVQSGGGDYGKLATDVLACKDAFGGTKL